MVCAWIRGVLARLSATAEELSGSERFERLALGAPDIATAVRELQSRGLPFVEAGALRPSFAGALSRVQLGSAMFELVRHGAA
jgi:hypothetical protein